MHRSASTNNDFFSYQTSAPSSSSSKASPSLRALALEANELPLHEPLSEVAKKEKSRAKFAENAVHIIPFILLVCAFILWFFSNPDVDVRMRSDPISARIEGLTIEGEIDSDSDGTQTTSATGVVPLDLGDHDDYHSKTTAGSSRLHITT